MEEKIKCKRCGKCCHWYDVKTDYWVPCQYLRMNKGLATCSMYKYRIGLPMNRHGDKIRCGYRKDSHNFKGCPYNVLNLNKPIVF